MKLFTWGFGGPLMLVRIVFGFLITPLTVVLLKTVEIVFGRKTSMSKWLFGWVFYLLGRGWSLAISIVWINNERPVVCYKKYLGPDWKPTYEGAGSVVHNHPSWIDIPVLMTRYMPHYVSKASVAKVPLIGYLAKMGNSIFFDRKDKDERNSVKN